MVQDFINMTLFANLRGNTDDGKGPPTLVDALEFTHGNFRVSNAENHLLTPWIRP